MSRPKRLLFIVDGMNAGGTQESIYNFALHFKDNPITIISLFGENSYRNRLENLPHVRFENLSSAKGTNRRFLVWLIPLVAIRFFYIRKRILRDFDWVQVCLPLSLLLFTFTRIHKHVACYYNIDCDTRQLRGYERLVFRLCLPRIPLVGVASTIRNGYAFLKLAPGRLVDPPVFVSSRIPAVPKVYRFEKTIVFIGRLVEQKGLKDAIEIISELNVIQPGQFGLIVIGDGALRHEHETMCRMKGLDFVEFTGYVDNLEDYLHNADAMIKTSFGEPANLSVREFIALGKPVFSTIESELDRDLIAAGRIFPIYREKKKLSAETMREVLLDGTHFSEHAATLDAMQSNALTAAFFKRLIHLPPASGFD